MGKKKNSPVTLPGDIGLPSFRAKVSGGNLVFELPNKVGSYIEPLEGLLVEVKIRKERPSRSLNQNAYYWGVVLDLLSRHTGHSDDEMHEVCRYMFLKRVNEDGFEYVASTAALSAAEFEAYLEDIRRWASMFLDLVIPDPKKLAA